MTCVRNFRIILVSISNQCMDLSLNTTGLHEVECNVSLMNLMYIYFKNTINVQFQNLT
jgi:hypothetical protein